MPGSKYLALSGRFGNKNRTLCTYVCTLLEETGRRALEWVHASALEMAFLLRSSRALKECLVQKVTCLSMANNFPVMHLEWGFDEKVVSIEMNSGVSRTMPRLSLIRVVESLWYR